MGSFNTGIMKHFKPGYLAIGFILSLSCSFSIAGTDLEKQLERLKHADQAYFDQLVESNTFSALLSEIENGNGALIEDAYLFKPFTDASTTLELRIALSRALPVNPSAVMSLIPTHFSADDLCIMPFIEAPLEVEQAFITETIAALTALNKTTPSLDTCLGAYHHMLQNLSEL